MQSNLRSAATLAATLMLAACGGSSSSAPPAVDPPATANPDAAITIQLENDLDAMSVVAGSSSFGTGEVRLSYFPGRDIGNVSAQVELESVEATRVTLRSGYAGTEGDELIAFSQASDSRWSIPAGQTLTPEQGDMLEAGAMYIRVDTALNPGGALRGQLSGDNVEIVVAQLSGDQEVPVVETAGTGTVATTVNTASGEIRVHVNTQGIDDATAAHVHRAFAGSNGGVIIGLAQENDTQWSTEATLDDDGLAAYRAGELYLNLHSSTNASGEIRSQIAPSGIDVQFVALSGMQQFPNVSTTATGMAATTLDTATGAVVVHVNTSGLSDNAFAAHVHSGFAGAGGGVVIGLDQDAADPGHFMATSAVLDTDGLALYDAGELYVNVHTNDHPGGELRGQIAPDSVDVIFAPLSGAQAVPEVASTAYGTVASTYHHASGRLTVNVHTTDADAATAAHVHSAYAGANGGVAVGLAADAATVGIWSADAVLDTGGQAQYLAGQFYVNIHTPTNPGGELRGQIVPGPIELAFSRLDGEQSVPAVATEARGLAATTLNPVTGAIVAHVHTNGVDDASAAHIHIGAAGANGGVALGLEQDAGDMAHWMTPAGAMLDRQGVADFLAGSLYFNVHTPENPGGEIRGQIDPDILGSNDPLFALFANKVQRNTTLAICIWCHVDGGFAAITPLRYRPATVAAHTEYNLGLIRAYVNAELNELGSAQRYLDKPTTVIEHAGGMWVDPTSDEFADLATLARGLERP